MMVFIIALIFAAGVGIYFASKTKWSESGMNKVVFIFSFAGTALALMSVFTGVTIYPALPCIMMAGAFRSNKAKHRRLFGGIAAVLLVILFVLPLGLLI